MYYCFTDVKSAMFREIVNSTRNQREMCHLITSESRQGAFPGPLPLENLTYLCSWNVCDWWANVAAGETRRKTSASIKLTQKIMAKTGLFCSQFNIHANIWAIIFHNYQNLLACFYFFHHIYLDRPFHGFRRHLGWGSVAAKISAHVWEIVQLSNLVTPLLYNRVWEKSCLLIGIDKDTVKWLYGVLKFRLRSF